MNRKSRVTRRSRSRQPHHGRGGSRHVGRVRIRLSRIISECLGWDCEPEDLQPAGGRQRNNTTMSDGYAWEVFTSTQSGHIVVAGSFDTMTDCVRAGRVTLSRGEIQADWDKAE